MSLTSIANPASNPQAYTNKLSMLSMEQLQRLAQTRDMAVVAAVMGEINRRKQISTAAQGQQPQQPTVRDQALASIAPQRLPEESGIGQLPAPNMERMAGGGIVAFSGATGSYVDEPTQEERDLAAIKRGGAGATEAAKSLAAAGYDLATLLPRGVMGAAESVITRPLRALGVPVPYLPASVYGGDASSMTPMMDKLRRQRGEGAPTPAPTPAAVSNVPDHLMASNAIRTMPAMPTPEKETAEASPSGQRPSGLGAAASALKLPDFGSTTPQSISDIAKEAEPFLAKRRAENAELLKPEQDAVNALHASIAESKKGDVRQQLLGIAAGFLSSKSPHFAHGIGDAVTNYMNISKEQKKFNADAVKEATAAQTALARYKVALDKGDEATAAKYKEIADSKADRAIGHQLQGIQLGIAAKQADTQAAHYGTMSDIARQRLQLVKDASSHDVKVGQEYTKIEKQVDDRLAKDTNYTMASPEQQAIMRNNALQEKVRNHPLLGKLAGGIGFTSSPTGKTYDLTGEMGS